MEDLVNKLDILIEERAALFIKDIELRKQQQANEEDTKEVLDKLKDVFTHVKTSRV